MRWLLVFLAVAALTVVSCGGSSESESTSPTASQPLASGGALTDDERRKLKEIVQSDPVIAEIAGNAPFTLEEIGPWSVGTLPETGEEIFAGGIATMVLSQKIGHIERDLPFATIRTYYTSWSAEDRAKYMPYKEGIARFAVDNLSRLHLSVDIERGKVAGIRVMPEQQYEQRVAAIPVEPAPQSTAGVSQVSTDIFNADARVTAVLAGRAYQSAVGNTYSIANAHFAAHAVHFDAIETLEADWLLLFEFDQKTGAYESQTVHFKATDVEALSVVIDLDKGTIAWMEPIRKRSG